MDIKNLRIKSTEVIKKYRYALIVLLLGIALMAMPKWGKEDTKEPAKVTIDVTDWAGELEKILSHIDGVGKVKLMLTLDTGQITVYQSDKSEGGLRHETVIVTDSNRTQQGLIQHIRYPKYRGAVVICQGAADPAVRLAVVEAVADATGLGADRISVLKMK